MIKINPTGHKDRIPSVDTVVSLPDYRLHSAWTSLNLHRWAKQSLNYPDRLTAIHRFSGELSCVWVVLRRLLTAHSFQLHKWSGGLSKLNSTSVVPRNSYFRGLQTFVKLIGPKSWWYWNKECSWTLQQNNPSYARSGIGYKGYHNMQVI